MAARLHAEVVWAAAWLHCQCPKISTVTGLQPLLHSPSMQAAHRICWLHPLLPCCRQRPQQELPYAPSQCRLHFRGRRAGAAGQWPRPRHRPPQQLQRVLFYQTQGEQSSLSQRWPLPTCCSTLCHLDPGPGQCACCSAISTGAASSQGFESCSYTYTHPSICSCLPAGGAPCNLAPGNGGDASCTALSACAACSAAHSACAACSAAHSASSAASSASSAVSSACTAASAAANAALSASSAAACSALRPKYMSSMS